MTRKRRLSQDGEAPTTIDVILMLVEKGRIIVKASLDDKLTRIVELANNALKDTSVEFTDHEGKKMRLDRNKPNIVCDKQWLDLEKTLEQNNVRHESTLYIYYQFYPVVEDDGSCIVM
jgi:hypothetical protein